MDKYKEEIVKVVCRQCLLDFSSVSKTLDTHLALESEQEFTKTTVGLCVLQSRQDWSCCLISLLYRSKVVGA